MSATDPTEAEVFAALTGAAAVTGGATAANQTAQATLTGPVTETAPATDTASSGLNGRLQRIAQRITSQMALLGEVQASPTANTILDRLKVLATGLFAKGTAGTPSADVMSVQGVANGTGMAVTQPGTVVSATPTLDTSAYAIGDCLHTAVIEFANALPASHTGFVEKMVIVDALAQSQPCELWLFKSTVAPATANAAHSISDADALLCIGVISSGPYYASALNSVSIAKALSLAINTTGTSLFGILVTRGTPTYGAGSLTVSLLITAD